MADYCYTLQSCNPLLYPSFVDLCSPTANPYSGQIVTIDGQPIDETYSVIFHGVDVCVCSGPLPLLVLSDYTSCTDDFGLYKVRNCDTSEEKTIRVEVTEKHLYLTLSNVSGTEYVVYDIINDVMGPTVVVPMANSVGTIAVDKINGLVYLVGPLRGVNNIVTCHEIGDPSTQVVVGTIPPLVAGVSGTRIVTLTYNPVDKFLYYNENTSPADGYVGQTLFKMDPLTGIITLIGTFTYTPFMANAGGDLVPSKDLNIIYHFTQNFLYELNLTTLNATLIYTDTMGNPSTFAAGAGDFKGALMYLASIGAGAILDNKIFEYNSIDNTVILLNQFLGLDFFGDAASDVNTLVPGTVYKESDDCGCWEVLEEVSTYDSIEIPLDFYENCSDCLSDQAAICETGERTKGFANRVTLPTQPVVDKGFKECCFELVVLADLIDSADYKNDYSGFWDTKQLPNDTVDYFIVDTVSGTPYSITGDTYGIYNDFGSYPTQPDLKTFVIEWKKVLTILGAGCYQLEKTVTVAGVGVTLQSNTFTLKPYSVINSDKTVRIDSVQDGRLEHLDVDFKGTGFKTSLRTKGFFGRTQHGYTQDNIVFRDYNSTQISMELNREFLYETTVLPSCITKEIFEFILFGNELFANDYNTNNHDYNTFVRLPIELAESSETEYNSFARKAKVNLKFIDRLRNKRKTNC